MTEPLEKDDGSRPTFGVVVSLQKCDDGTVRIILDDVRSAEPRRATNWQFDCFYTHKRVDSEQATAMTLPDSEYEGLGAAVMARLLALNKMIK